MEVAIMKEINLIAKASWLSPGTLKKVNKGRLYTDIFGLLLVYTFGGLFPASIQWIFSIYTILAWITILTIDPSRLPDAAATKMNQKKAWKYFFVFAAPVYVVLFVLMMIVKAPIHIQPITFGLMASSIINACLIEVFYRTILQPKLRQMGMSSTASIVIQSLCFAILFYMKTTSFIVFGGTMLVGLINGILTYKTRSIQPNVIIMTLWLLLFHTI
jgi:membrane protease YdiL (CAAX protease family)